MGRFLSPDWSNDPDPLPYANLENPQSLNLYRYAGNNPLSKTDPDGHFTLTAPNNCWCDQAAQAISTLWYDFQWNWQNNWFKSKQPVPPPPVVTTPAQTANPSPDGEKDQKQNNKTDQRQNEKGGAQDKKLTSAEIENLKQNTGRTAEDIKEDALGTGKNMGRYDLYKSSDGDIVAKPKGSSGPGEPTGYTVEHLKPHPQQE
jgi:hypothetical protein